MVLVITKDGLKWQESLFGRLRKCLRKCLPIIVPDRFGRGVRPSHESFREEFSFSASLREDNSGRLCPDAVPSNVSKDCATTLSPTLSDFSYDGIDEHEIRLLTILPSRQNDGPIKTFLTSYTRNEQPRYAAVSYTWGNTTRECQIQCNGMRLNIGRNCKAALRALRLQSGPRTVWIDAICINQADLVERRAQVAAMGDVYRLANETFAYLGESSQSWDLTADIETIQ